MTDQTAKITILQVKDIEGNVITDTENLPDIPGRMTITCARNKFDGAAVNEELTEIIRQCGGTLVETNILCDICGKTYKDETKNIRKLCDFCGHYYDYCIEHPTPEQCPLCRE